MHVVIIDCKTDVNFRVISLYRSFHPPGGISTSSFFSKQLNLIKDALCPNGFIAGDFNLDDEMLLRPDYYSKLLLERLEIFVTSENLYQIIKFPTWSRVINKES